MSVSTQSQPKLLKAAEVAELLGCSVRTVKRLAVEGAIPSVRFTENGHVRFRARDVEQFIESGGKP